MASLTAEQNLKAEQAFAQTDEGGKGYLHSKEFFYACQALGFNYSFVECFEMYKIYDDNNSLRMNIDEFKRFYEAKIKDPQSHVDPNRVTNVYTNKTSSHGVSYIPNTTPASGVYTQETTTYSTTQHPQHVVSTSGGQVVTTSGPQVVTTNGGQTTTSTTYQTTGGTVVGGGQTYVTTNQQPTYVRQGQQIVTSGGQQIVTTGGTRVLQSGGHYVSHHPGTYVTGQRVGGATYTTGGHYLVNAGNEMARYDTENKGWITKEQLRVACKDLAVKCDTDAELDAIWNEIDLNQTGRVNSYEFGEFYDFVKGFRDIVRQKRA